MTEDETVTLAWLGRQMTRLVDRVESLHESMIELRADVSMVRESLRAIDVKVDSLSRRLDRYEVRLSRLEDTLAAP